jgi:tRNA (guanine37-N1)-methyltransferase
MNYTVLTLFPEMFSLLNMGGILKRSVEKRLVSIETMDIRDFAAGRHRTADDRPFGGGAGMVMKPEPLAGAIGEAKKSQPEALVVLLTPQGRLFDDGMARYLAGFSSLILVCGRYEGVDERVCQDMVDQDLSIGNYVLTGGELAAMVVIDAVSRLIPGALGNEQSAREDSFSTGLIKYPQYTRPRIFENSRVPQVLMSGDHEAIRQWRRRASIVRTFLKRPDLLSDVPLTDEDVGFLKTLQRDIKALIDRHTAAS